MGPVGIVLVGAGLVALGVVVFAMGHRQAVHTTPLIQVMPSYKADASNIINAINAIEHIQGNKVSEPTDNIPSSPVIPA